MFGPSQLGMYLFSPVYVQALGCYVFLLACRTAVFFPRCIFRVLLFILIA